jgi:hypothetical protein
MKMIQLLNGKRVSQISVAFPKNKSTAFTDLTQLRIKFIKGDYYLSSNYFSFDNLSLIARKLSS